ncbi:ABC transporter permease [Mesorhizobium sp. CN2-181]|uniref:ABC transporter permease n=1 Tax=Mesorhizobium yinganensis TaxID=3157707 RepID=UPI0032B74FC6
MTQVPPIPEAMPIRRGRKQTKPWLFWFAVVFAGAALFLAAFGEYVVPHSPTDSSFMPSMPPPPLADVPGLLWATMTRTATEPINWFGTDSSGFDVFSRVLCAPRIDLSIALAANALAMLIGIPFGLVAGYFRNPFTEFMMRASDVLQSFPVFISAMILVALGGQSILNVVLALSLLYAPIYVRLTRTEVLAQKSRGMVEASRAIGQSEMMIALKHVLPNSMGPALVQSSVTIGFAILLTAGLSFVGAGVRPPSPEWGLMISTGANDIVLGQWWTSVFPGIAISLTVFAFAVIGDALERRYNS